MKSVTYKDKESPITAHLYSTEIESLNGWANKETCWNENEVVDDGDKYILGLSKKGDFIFTMLANDAIEQEDKNVTTDFVASGTKTLKSTVV